MISAYWEDWQVPLEALQVELLAVILEIRLLLRANQPAMWLRAQLRETLQARLIPECRVLVSGPRTLPKQQDMWQQMQLHNLVELKMVGTI